MTGPRIPRVPESDVVRIANQYWYLIEEQQRQQAAAGANTGTLDCNLLQLNAPDPFRDGYVEGHQRGLVNGLFAGFLLGGTAVAGAIKLGLWCGGVL